jgi:O-antigen/teichoic acid export membrane protein
MRQSKRIALNTLTSWIGTFVNAAVLIFLTKFLLHRLGQDQFGMLRYILTLQGSLVILDLGLGGTLNRFASQLLTAQDINKLNAVFSLVFFLFLALGALAGVIMTCMGFILPSLVMNGSDELYAAGFVLIGYIGWTIALRFWSYAPRGLLFGAQRYDIVNGIQVVAAMLRAGGIVFLFMTSDSCGLGTIGICFLLSAVFETGLTWIFAKKQFPPMKIGVRTLSRAIAREVFGFSASVLLMGVTTMLIINAPTFLAGRLCQPEDIAYISIALLVLNQLQAVAGAFAFTLIPVAGKYATLKDQNTLRQIIITGTKFCATICFPVGAVTIILARPLFEWFDSSFGWAWGLLGIMTLPILVRATQRVPFSVLLGAGSVKLLAIGQIVVVLAIGFLSWLFAVYFQWGLYGIALGSAVPIFIFSATYQPFHACRQVGLNWLTFLWQAYGCVVLWTIPSTILGLVLLRVMYPSGLIMMALEGVLCMLVFVPFAWWLVLTPRDRDQVIGIFRRKLSPGEVAKEPEEVQAGVQ